MRLPWKSWEITRLFSLIGMKKTSMGLWIRFYLIKLSRKIKWLLASKSCKKMRIRKKETNCQNLRARCWVTRRQEQTSLPRESVALSRGNPSLSSKVGRRDFQACSTRSSKKRTARPDPVNTTQTNSKNPTNLSLRSPPSPNSGKSNPILRMLPDNNWWASRGATVEKGKILGQRKEVRRVWRVIICRPLAFPYWNNKSFAGSASRFQQLLLAEKGKSRLVWIGCACQNQWLRLKDLCRMKWRREKKAAQLKRVIKRGNWTEI